MRTLKLLNHTGHVEVDLDADVDLAKQLFEEAINNGHMAYFQETEGSKKVQINEFKPDAYEIVLAPPLVGG